MKLKDLFRRDSTAAVSVQTARSGRMGLAALDRYVPLQAPEAHIYSAMRQSIPIIDAAIGKIVKLCGGFTVTAEGNGWLSQQLGDFLADVQVGATCRGADNFIAAYLDQLLTYGTAVGEVVVDGDEVCALYNAPLSSLEINTEASPLQATLYKWDGINRTPLRYPELICISALDPEPGKATGVSLLRGLPFVSNILLKIYNSLGVNFDRMGNLRFAVNYKPSGDALDRVSAKERAEQIAEQWSQAMQSDCVRDFVSVGDVDIKVIGADNQLIDCQVPARLMLEQIVAKTGLPPFMLGLSWSSTERMSKQQADMLTSELEHYRRILTPVILRICGIWQRLHGVSCPLSVEWQTINLQDETELAEAALKRAQAAQIEQTLKGENND